MIMDYSRSKESLIGGLFDIGAIKFGDFTLKSGEKSPVYCDLRLLVSHPKLMQLTSELIAELIKVNHIDYDIICGVPVGAIPIATILSVLTDKPMILKRKEVKDYGTKKIIEGTYKPNDRCLIVEDVTTTGSSILETNDALKGQMICVNHSFVVLDRQQGADTSLRNHGIELHSVLNLNDVLETLILKKKIPKQTYDQTKMFLTQKK